MALVEVGKFDVTVRLMDDLVPEKITPTVHPDEKVDRSATLTTPSLTLTTFRADWNAC